LEAVASSNLNKSVSPPLLKVKGIAGLSQLRASIAATDSAGWELEILIGGVIAAAERLPLVGLKIDEMRF
jgi:hypothetical protein